MREDLSTFLDLACLAYKGNDSPARRARAAEMLAADASLGADTIFGAAVTGDVPALRTHLDAGVAASARGGPRDWPPLLYLCYSRVSQADPVGTLEILLARGADPTAHFIAWGSPFTAITGAVGQGEQGPQRLPTHPEATALVERLLDAGASPNDCQTLYNTMLGDDERWLRLFISRGLNAEHNITWPIEGGCRSLDFVLANAVDCGRAGRVELLLAQGANPNCVNTYNGRPLHTNALLGGHDAIARRLVQAGATVAPLTPEEEFRRAVAVGNLASARVTPQVLANPEHLLEAANRGDLDTVRFLIASGAPVNAADAQGVTPLHRAAWADNVEIVRLLLEAGADPSLQDNNYRATARGWALHNGSAAAAELLE